MNTALQTGAPNEHSGSLRSALLRILLHAGFLVIAIGCLAAYEHFKAEGQSTASLVSVIAAALFGFAPLRDVAHVFFRVEGGALHLVHGLGGLALISLPVTGVISGAPVLSRTAMAPFAIMGAAQAVMHQNQPRNAAQAAAMQRSRQVCRRWRSSPERRISPHLRTRDGLSKPCRTSSARLKRSVKRSWPPIPNSKAR